MRITYAARFSVVIFLVATLFTLFLTRTGLRIVGVSLPRQVWLAENSGLWAAGWWLWLPAIFSWMLLLTTLMWSYLPGHRLNSMLQSGLVIIGAILSMSGIVIWMNVLPGIAALSTDSTLITLVDDIALSLLGAGLAMMGIVTIWILIDLYRQDIFERRILLPGILTGLCLLPTPLLLPRVENLALGLLLWLVWCGLLATRTSFPNMFPEWQ